MPPLPQYPNQPTGSPDIRPYPYGGGGYDASAGYAGQYGQPGYGQGQGYGYGQGVDYVTPEQWAAAIQQAKDFLKYQAGGATPFEREQAYAKWQDAEKGYRNSLKIAQLQADTSRYGYDQQRQSQIDQLKQNDRQFAANHQLDVRKADISEAQLIAEQRSQPNRLFQTMDLEQALGSIRAGNHATTMAMPTGVAAFDGLSTDYRGNPYLAGGAGGSGATGSPTGASGATGTDPRIKAARSVMDALPPSATEGLDPTGVAALNAVYSLYHAPLRPGTLESLSPTQQAGLQSGAARVQQYTGKSYDDFVQDYRRALPGQGSARAA
jgi:hypothetical protein